MPTPLEILMDPISLVVLGMYAALILWEALAPGRPLPQVKNWRRRGLAAFAVYFFLASYLPLLWDRHLVQFQLFDLSGAGHLGGFLIGLFVSELGIYWWHRSMHSSPILWRSFHQMHHSAERLDSFGAFWFSPLDMMGWTLLGSLALVLVAGVTAQAATSIMLLTTFLAIFQHTNIRTPRWLGYFIQRPESHTIHHGKGMHKNNYADLPMFDMLFGTFQNPRGYEMETGFYPGASDRVADMLLFKDVSEPGAETRQARAAT